MSKRKQYLAIASLLSIMLGMSLLGGSRGVMVPVLKKDFLITDSMIGIMFLISTAGYMIFTYISGVLIYKLGNKKLMQIGLLIVTFSLGTMFWSPSFNWFVFGYFLNGVGNAFLILGVNMTTPLFAVAFQAALLNIIHGSYGLGSAIIQRLTGFLIANNISWRVMFLYFTLFHLGVLAYVTFTSYPWQDEKSQQTSEPNDIRVNSNRALLSNKMLYLYILALGLGLLGEHGINNWFVNYMKEGFGINENAGSLYLSSFFVLFTIGRFFGGFVLEKIGYMRGVIWAQLITVGIYITGLMLGEQGLIFLTAAGIFQAIIYPTIVVTIPKVFPHNPAQAMAFISIGTSIINNLSSLLIGVLNDNIGVIKAFFIVPVWVLLSGIAAYAIYRNTKQLPKNSEAISGLEQA